MAVPIEDYALLSDTESAALVSRDGSIDWLGFPRFDSPACFAALLGGEAAGRWQIAPEGDVRRCRRRYRTGLVLETEFETDDGIVAVIDCMPPRDGRPDLVRVVEGRTGRVPMAVDLRIRFEYGSVVPWVRTVDGTLTAVAGPESLALATPVELSGVDHRTVGRFEVGEGDRVPFVLEWGPSHERPRCTVDAEEALAGAEEWWNAWAEQCTYDGPWRSAVVSSLAVLKGLTYAPTGGIVAAPTTSLPETIGGERNWDYRYCWLRDATFTLSALLDAGYRDEAVSWRDWLLRAVAGDPSQIQALYGVAGERRLDEWEVPWLAGYEDSVPVRIGNAAATQLQIDVFGEVMNALHEARAAGIPTDDDAWSLQRALIDRLAEIWTEPDEGIWEVRGGRRHFAHSKVMAWVAFDRMIRGVEEFGLDGPADDWRSIRSEIHAQVCERAVDERGVFTQSYGDSRLDASLLVIPIVGFLPAEDPRVVATVDAICEELATDDFVLRYRVDGVDGLAGDEGAFLLCTFWQVQALSLLGRHDEAVERFESLLAVRNDVGLLAEEYDAGAGRQLGNFPQAFSHLAVVATALTLAGRES